MKMLHKKQKNKSPLKGPLARKIIASSSHLTKNVKQISDWQKTKITAENFKLGVVAKDLSHLDPVHAVYVYVRNQLSYLEEAMLDLSVLDKLAIAYINTSEKYMPDGPPMSPLTGSYFTSWAAFDLCSNGAKRESLGTIAIALYEHLNVDTGFIDIIHKLQQSRMGIYVCEQVDGEFIFLRELITNKKIKTICSSRYKGQQGEVWFVRVLPPPFDHPSYDHSVTFTTPYILGKQSRKKSFDPAVEMDWLAYLIRNFKKTKVNTSREDYFEAAYEELMKYGLTRNYWSEYIFLSYANHQHEMISLSGFPDIPSSLPHSEKGYDQWDL